MQSIIVEEKQQVIEEEVLSLARLLAAAGLGIVVIDTESRFLQRGFAEKLASVAHGTYYRLPQISSASSSQPMTTDNISPLVRLEGWSK